MTIECAMRFQEPINAPKRAHALLTATEAATAQALSGGFWFKTERSPTELLATLEAAGLPFAAFESIDFKNI